MEGGEGEKEKNDETFYSSRKERNDVLDARHTRYNFVGSRQTIAKRARGAAKRGLERAGAGKGELQLRAPAYESSLRVDRRASAKRRWLARGPLKPSASPRI